MRPARLCGLSAQPTRPPLYRLLFWLVLRRMDPERAHGLAVWTLKLLSVRPVCVRMLRAVYGETHPSLRVRALGLELSSPLGVAAGMDKEASCFEALGALGFGFVEVGTVTAVGQPGNERPRIFRVPSGRALLNRMGFPNSGAEAVAGRLCKRGGSTGKHAAGARPSGPYWRGSGSPIVGVNVGKSRATPLERAAGDYRETVRAVARCCDYLAINVSSPNTPGLRELQDPDRLREIVGAIREELSALEVRRPLLVKISPDLSDPQLDELADVALELKLDGIVAVNTTLDRGGVEDCREIASVEGGGVSGAPLARRSLEVLRRLRARVGDRLVLVSVGGVESADDVWERILAGATLVQAYTGFVYGGPSWPRAVNRGLAERVAVSGQASIAELVGTTARGRTA
jgi:dihydroorotate dehydrogenase